MSQNTQEYIEFRRAIFESVKAEMLGPGSEDVGPDVEEELITDSPLERYSLGILFPQDNRFEHEEDEKYDTSEDEPINHSQLDLNMDNADQNGNMNYIQSNAVDENDETQEQISMANQLLPSAMGLTIFLKGDVKELKVRVKCARYRVSQYRDCCVRLNDDFNFIGTGFEEYVYKENEYLKLKQNMTKTDVFNLTSGRQIYEERKDVLAALYKLSEQCSDEKSRKYGYVRIPVIPKNPVTILLDQDYKEVDVIDDENLKLSLLRRSYSDNIDSYTIMLINEYTGRRKFSNSYFQPEISINTIDNPDIIFVEHMAAGHMDRYKMSEEEESLQLLYRNKRNYAVGHGVATSQEVDDKTGKGKVWTSFFPYYEVPQIDFNIREIKDFSENLLSMYKFSDLSDMKVDDRINLLKDFSKSYSTWINNVEDEINILGEKYSAAGERHIKFCREALDRINDSIELLQTDKNVQIAYELMNRAMLMQRAHSVMPDRFPDDEEIPYENVDYVNQPIYKASWRPFQLAFILLNIKAISDTNYKYHDIVDLIWVPTGGGKTEAYLGITAFTIFLRRLRDPQNGGGTTVIMRYTLRLLAAQQFIRASILICACEVIRREGKHKLGKEEITIGLWVGSSPTPNTNVDAKRLFKNLIKKVSSESELNHQKMENNKFQVLKCPWCGTKLEKEYVDCKVKGDWGYNYDDKKIIFCPEQDCEFNFKLPIQVVDEEIYKNPPTLLFGTVDKFAQIAWKSEVARLFALDHGNKTKQPELIIQDELHLISGPLGTMVGLYETAIDAMCSAKGIKPKIVASTATISRASEQCKMLFDREVRQFPPSGSKIEDSFFVRELDITRKPGRLYVGMMPSGKTAVTAQVRLFSILLQCCKFIEAPEEVKDKYWTVVGYFNSLRELGKSSTLIVDDVASNMTRLVNRLLRSNERRFVGSARELTSRLDSTAIIKTLKDLENEYSEEDVTKAINILLATNMISVGVDVSRLDIMVAVGQPKLTSEYIQATSRVGRSQPGIVFTLYNGSKTRDRSHYELFYPYHQSFYKYVEPTSVTPFSEQARERALHAIFISMVRHILGLNAEEAASEFNDDIEGLENIKEFILKRAGDLNTSEVSSLRAETEKELTEIIEKWSSRIDSLTGNELLTYSKESQKHLIRPYSDDVPDNSWQTMQSMRSVDGESGVEIVIFGED